MNVLARIFVQLLDEGVDVWRPVEAEPLADGFRIVGGCPDDERWEFQPGDVVRCEMRVLEKGTCLVAIEPVVQALRAPRPRCPHDR